MQEHQQHQEILKTQDALGRHPLMAAISMAPLELPIRPAQGDLMDSRRRVAHKAWDLGLEIWGRDRLGHAGLAIAATLARAVDFQINVGSDALEVFLLPESAGQCGLSCVALSLLAAGSPLRCSGSNVCWDLVLWPSVLF
jgi:hypothetical protein